MDIYKTMPDNPSTGHQEDIMSIIYYSKYKMLFTGAHDGTIISWNFETKSRKNCLSDNDPTCTSKNFIEDGKSVD